MPHINERTECDVWGKLLNLHINMDTRHRFKSIELCFSELKDAAPEKRKPALLYFADAAIRRAVGIKRSVKSVSATSDAEYKMAVASVKKIVGTLRATKTSYGNLILWYYSYQSHGSPLTDEDKIEMMNCLVIAAGESIAYYNYITQFEI